MRPDARELRAAAAVSGFAAETVEKVVRLGELLDEVSRHPLLGHVLALKGGTALNLALDPPPRLSVDLDFDLVGAAELAAMRRERPRVEAAIARIARALGYRVQVSRDEHAGRKHFLGYTDLFGGPSRVEIDVNYLHRVPLAEVEILPVWQPEGMPRPVARCLSLEEIAVGKLCAALDRGAPRDLFDVASLPARLGRRWGSQRFRRVFVALGATLPRPLAEYGPRRFARATPAAIARTLAPMLRAAEAETLPDLSARAWDVVAPLVALDDAEREFHRRIGQGELLPELLFPDDPGLAGRLAHHPALLRKAENAKRHVERGGG